MLRIDKGHGMPYSVILTQGDSAAIKLTLKDEEGNAVTLGDMDTAVLSVKRSLDDTAYVLQLTIEDMQFVFKPGDTKTIHPGVYWFDVEVRMAGGEIYTVIPPSKFLLAKGVT